LGKKLIVFQSFFFSYLSETYQADKTVLSFFPFVVYVLYLFPPASVNFFLGYRGLWWAFSERSETEHSI